MKEKRYITMNNLSKYLSHESQGTGQGFTLIELLIVVAIIGILAAIAIPNFLSAQIRAKVSRAKSDMRTLGTGIEMYNVDSNQYPPGYKTASRYGFNVLTSPVSYVPNVDILEPFSDPSVADHKRYFDYELVNSEAKIIESGGGPYSVDPVVDPNGVGKWWWLASRGPDHAFGFRFVNPEYNIRERFYFAGTNPQPFLDTIYNPTNGTISIGNIYFAGGSDLSPAGRMMK